MASPGGSRDELVAAYGRYHAMLLGDREERLAAHREHGWARDEVYRFIDRDDTTASGAEVLQLIEDLLNAPDADAVAIGCGPLEDVLVEWPELAGDMAVRCSQEPVWSRAIAEVELDELEYGRAAPLHPWLPAPADAE